MSYPKVGTTVMFVCPCSGEDNREVYQGKIIGYWAASGPGMGKAPDEVPYPYWVEDSGGTLYLVGDEDIFYVH